jgi:uncharacterized RDD family membrane protein YckC
MSEGLRVTTHNFQYAAWYVRLAAVLIDHVIVWLAILLLVPGSFLFSTLLGGGHYAEMPSFFLSMDGIWFWLLPLIYLVVFWAILSRTPGMMLMKIKVADYEGGNISVLQAFLRIFAYLLAAIPLFLGFLPVIWTKKRQGLHDRLVRTLVIRKR